MILTKVTRKIRALLPLGRCGAVIVAAGNATRMGGIDKNMAMLCGEPVIVRTVRAFEECEAIREIVVVTRPDLIVAISDLCAGMTKVKAVVAGGESRQASVLAGLYALSRQTRLAAIHDGARPLVTWQLIDRVVRAANAYGAAVPAVPLKDTVKESDRGFVRQTPDRNALRAIQTPQVFDMDLLRCALKKAEKDGAALTDDSSAVERLKMSVKIVEGDERNLKITTPMDLKIAALFLEETL